MVISDIFAQLDNEMRVRLSAGYFEIVKKKQEKEPLPLEQKGNQLKLVSVDKTYTFCNRAEHCTKT